MPDFTLLTNVEVDVSNLAPPILRTFFQAFITSGLVPDRGCELFECYEVMSNWSNMVCSRRGPALSIKMKKDKVKTILITITNHSRRKR